LGDVNPAGSLGEIQMLGTAVKYASDRNSILDKQFIANNYQCQKNIRFSDKSA